MNSSVNGILGAIKTEKLGRTLIHEHVVTCCDWSLRMALGSIYCEDEILYAMTVKQLKKAKDAGIDTIVDGTPINLGRDIPMMRRAASEVGIQIIASSGFYHDENAILLWKSEDEIYRLLYRDCTEGMTDTDSLPGILKCAVDLKGFTPYVCKILRVTARVSRELDLPIFCHTIPQQEQGGQLLDIMEENQVAPSSVICGHSGDHDDLDYLESLARRGCYLGFDCFGITDKYPSTTLDNRVETLYQMCVRGWADRILISHDYVPYSGFFPDWEECRKPEFTDREVDYRYFQNHAVPLLLKKGLKQKDIDQMLIDNPRNFFEGKNSAKAAV